jgi:hypothetical protein
MGSYRDLKVYQKAFDLSMLRGKIWINEPDQKIIAFGVFKCRRRV